MAYTTEEIIKQMMWEESASESAAKSAIDSMRRARGDSQIVMSIGRKWVEENIDRVALAAEKMVSDDRVNKRSDGRVGSILSGLDGQTIAITMLSFAARACLSAKPVKYSSMSCDAGIELCAVAEIKRAKEEFSKEAGVLRDKKSAQETLNWYIDRGISANRVSREDAKYVGVKVCETLISEKVINVEKYQRSYVVVADSIAEVIESNMIHAIAMSHQAVPTLIKPRPWSHVSGEVAGGFHGALRSGRSHMIRTNSNVQRMINETWGSMKSVVSAVNKLQDVAWSIDDRVFSVMRENDHLLTQQEKLMMSAAEKMLGHERHYHVWTADYRYRLYSEAGLINPQGGDVQKSLLRAAKGKAIGDDEDVVKLFKIGVAGKYGVDNVSIPERIDWVNSHHDEIISSAKNPEECKFWSTAEKPWQFLQICFEYAGWIDDPHGFLATVVATPLDGKCSGIQHFSAMGRDPIGAKATCLGRNKKGDSPRDIYNEVRDVVNLRVKNEYQRYTTSSRGRLGEKFMCDSGRMARAWTECGVDRCDVKRSVMTMPYSATERACLDQILSSMREKGKLPDCQFEAAKFLQPIVWESIPKVVGYARKAMDYLKDSVKLAVKHNESAGKPWFEFKNPNGAMVYQVCWKNKSRRLRVGGMQISINEQKVGSVDMRKHVLGVSPNFIHSCDAAHMHNVINRMNIDFMHVIHDSFGALPSDTPALYRVVREEMVKMYKSFGLHMLREQYPFIRRASARGSFDIDEIIDSEFAFL